MTITLPDAGKRFMSLQILNQDEYTPAVYYGSTLEDFEGAFGTKSEVDPVRHLIGAAAPGAAIRQRTPFISMSRPQRTTGRPCTSSTSKMCR